MISFFSPFKQFKKLIVISVSFLSLVFLFSTLHSQDMHFSMYEHNPLYLNPASTGDFIGDWRLSGNFRNQMIASSESFRTTSIGFDNSVFILNQKIGLGMYIMNDESGVGGLSFNKFYISLGYQYEINKNYFSLGLQAGYVFGSINSWGTWSYTNGDFSSPNGENNSGNRSRYADLNLGIHWKRNIKILEPEIGIALSHLNKPNVSFTGAKQKENAKFTLSTRVKVNISDKFFIYPSFLYVGKGTTMTMLGTNIGYNILGNNSSVKQFMVGAYMRNGLTEELNTLVLILGTTVNRIDIGLAYDMNAGQLGESIGNTGAFEISFIYRSISTVLNSYSIPCERY
jgi:type IX secretion system PorP/SprF family membrane protein